MAVNIKARGMGQYTLFIEEGFNTVAHMNILLTPTQVDVEWIETMPSRRCEGFATRLLNEAKKTWPDRTLTTTGFTKLGQNIRKHFEEER